MAKIKAVALCRVSTLQQQVEGHSLESQEDNVKKAALELGCEIVKTWSLNKSSRKGKNLKRSDLEEILKYVKSNRGVKYLLVDKVNRLIRELKLFYYYMVLFELEGVRVYFCSPSEKDLNGDDPITTLKTAIKAYEAESDNQERINTVIERMRARVRAGYYPFNVHPGYKKGEEPGLHVPNHHFKTLKIAFKEVLSGISTPNEALQRLTDSGYRTKAGKPLKIDKFINMLLDEYYYGVLDIKGVINVRNESPLHTTMIEKESYPKMLDLLGKRPRNSYERKHYNPDFPLQKVNIYHKCEGNKTLTGAWKSNGKGKRYANYRCLACGKEFKRDSVHASISKELSKIQLDDKYRKKLLKALKNVYQKKQADSINKLAYLSRKIKEYEDQINNLVIKLADVSPKLGKHIESAIQKLEIKIDSAEKEKELLSKQQEEIVDFVRFTLEYIDRLQKKWWSALPEDRKRCQELLFSGGISLESDKKIGTHNLAALYRLNPNKKELRIARNSLLVELEGIAPSSIRTSI